MAPELSILNGPTDQPLWTITLGSLIDFQARAHGDRTALVVPWQNVRRSYNDLATRSKIIAKALLQSGLRYGDCIGIMAGNCSEYIEVFLGAARIGVTSVVLNSNYTPTELCNAISFSDIKQLFIARFPGPKLNFTAHIERVSSTNKNLKIVVFDDEEYAQRKGLPVQHFDTFYAKGQASDISDTDMMHKQALVRPADTLNLQFTSGTTGAPKAAMLSHANLINNANLLGDRIRLTETDIICCPPPLFHCFGLVMGFLCAFTRGSSIVYPSQQFDAALVLKAIEIERCSFLHGVPTMFTAQLDENTKRNYDLKSLKVALAAGSQVPQKLVNRLEKEMGISRVLIAYGMTETSPVTFCARSDDTIEQRLSTVGTLLPHTGVKVVDLDGRVVPHGIAGEICTSGYALQKGYLKDIKKTDEVMETDASGICWMHTGDQGVLDKDGYLRITGRIKDLIIRGGENIVPAEIEERLLAHPSIVEAAVVGVPHEKYGEAVACFLRQAEQNQRPTGAELAAWVRETLGRHKTPEYVWWVGDNGVGDDFPKTASGKHQKHILRSIGTEIIKGRSRVRPRL
ncbi:putative acyl-CoA synthetase [Cercospora beticola]|uniref:Putative acyl-CoA synthetase n=1 Tax=Cercospora beticola TaxID=122368 RepID=A0A2G5HZT7_CERBT|nr:putative acyl-CoA synthetase [Cercospora beticola]PIA98048.1 putative acyl-CoA synthetase [Cercospora beticola]WPA98936.1 hypothetical protein RHO25_003549 [Cercospora beticola]CAK1360233.1 unnamed protein product [Cercospora beticola]